MLATLQPGRCSGGLAGTGWLFAPAEQRWFCQQFGNGLLTTVPIDRWQRIPLPNQFAKSCRNMLLVQTRYRNRTVHILLTHLIRSDESLRRQQFQQASALFLSLDEPALLAGDLNADGSDPQIKELLRTPGVIDALGSLRRSDQNRGVDWLLLRGLQPMEAGVRDDSASDHPLVWAAVTLPGKNDPTTTAAEQERGMASTKRKRLHRRTWPRTTPARTNPSILQRLAAACRSEHSSSVVPSCSSA